MGGLATVSGEGAAVVGVLVALALLWLFIAVAMAIIAARRVRLAQQVLEAAQSNARLLETMPARPLLVHPDQRIEADEQLLRGLGLETRPARLSDLAGSDSGIAPDDLEALTAESEAARTPSAASGVRVGTDPDRPRRP